MNQMSHGIALDPQTPLSDPHPGSPETVAPRAAQGPSQGAGQGPARAPAEGAGQAPSQAPSHAPERAPERSSGQPGLQPAPRGARLSEADARLLREALVGGEAPLARQGDLIELHKRIVQLFATLGSGLGEAQTGKAAEDRAALVARLDELETAVNRMEGALRIEFEPVLRHALEEVMAAHPPARRGRLGPVLALLAGLGLGAGLMSLDATGLGAVLSPYGGSLMELIGLR